MSTSVPVGRVDSAVVPAVPLATSKVTAAPVNPAAHFDEYRNVYQGLTYEGLSRELGLGSPASKLSFVPTETQYFDRVQRGLAMTPDEIERFRQHGVVSVDHGQHEAMGSLYYSIWARELPVLITTDSILHALHRSYDSVLKELESTVFYERIDTVLAALHAQVAAYKVANTVPSLQASLEDVDLYVTVARNLLAGAGAPEDVWGHQAEAERRKLEKRHRRGGGSQSAAGLPATRQSEQLLIEPQLVTADQVRTILKLIASLTLQTPDAPTALFGGLRPVDYSQFKPRGHYEEIAVLQRYFRAMMWLGRSDLGFQLTSPAGVTRWVVELERERRDAALLMLLLKRSGSSDSLQSVSDVIDFMVGRADNPTPQELTSALEEAKIVDVAALVEAQNLERWVASIQAKRKTSMIRSQVQGAGQDGKETPSASYAQLFGQRFVLDSFMLSKLVYDSIEFQGVKPERMMPKGLDVMAALGNNHATELLKPDLMHYNYASNLMAARKVTAAYDANATWDSDVYGLWLDTLRTLQQPPVSEFFPQVMRTHAWQTKQLQTQLSSWAELRHDTILYAKQSYSSYPLCGYPRGYVEPYPRFFERLTALAREAAGRLSDLDVTSPDVLRTDNLKRERNQRVRFFDHFAEVTERLGMLASKELRGEPFTAEEEEFLQDTVQISSPGGSGGPRYDGWYSGLLYGVTPDESAPTIADVHTNPRDNEVLEVGVGDPTFLVVAIDNGKDKATYVGPAYSYYEFSQPASQRLTDSEWEQMLSSKPPARPNWMSSLVAPTIRRTLAGKVARRTDQVELPRPRTPQARLQQQINAENVRLRELERARSLATNERDRAAHQRAIDNIKLAKCVRSNPFPYDATHQATVRAAERAAECFKGTTHEGSCNFSVAVAFEPTGHKRLIYEPGFEPNAAEKSCVERAFDAIAAPKFCGEVRAQGAWVRCSSQ